jgi:hypothetical protein
MTVYKGQFHFLHLMNSAYNFNLYIKDTFQVPFRPFIYRFKIKVYLDFFNLLLP